MDSSEIVGTLLVTMLSIAAISCLIAMSTFIFLALRGNSNTLLSAGVNTQTRLSVVSTSFPLRPKEHLSWKQRSFLLVVAIGFLVCLFCGAETMLFWIPDQWGQFFQDNRFHPFKSTIAGLFALMVGGFIFYSIIESTTNRLRLRIAKIQISQERRIHDADFAESLTSLQHEFTQNLNELKGLSLWLR